MVMAFNGIKSDFDKIAANVSAYSDLFLVFFNHFTDDQTVDIKKRFRYKMVFHPHQTCSFRPKALFANCELSIRDDNGIYVPWIRSGPSLIVGAGTGLFASRDFNKGDIITIYLGRKWTHGEPTTYAFMDVTAADMKGELSNPYLLAQLINHAGEINPNCKIDGYKIVALKNIKRNEEFLLHYNRDIFCGLCSTQMDHDNKTFREDGRECSYINCTKKTLYAICNNTRCPYRLCKFHYLNAMIN